MTERFDEQLLQIKEKERNKIKWERRMEQLTAELREAGRTADELQNKLAEERHDIEKLHGLSLTNLFYTVLGSKADKLKTENEQLLAAKLRYDQAVESRQHIEAEIEALKFRLGEVINVEMEYERLMEAKESFIREQDPETSGKLSNLTEQKADLAIVCKELQEAVRAGELVQQSLERATDSLKSAKNWGTYDMLGGGMIATAVKHGRMDDAQDHIHTAQNRLRQFAKELKDVQISIPTDLEVSGLLKFSDFFFDGLIADWMVQGKINHSLESVMDQSREIDRLMSQLRKEEERTEQKLREIERQYSDILEKA